MRVKIKIPPILILLLLPLSPAALSEDAHPPDPLDCGVPPGTPQSSGAGNQNLFGLATKIDAGANQYACSPDGISCLFKFDGRVGTKAGTSGTIPISSPSNSMNLSYSFKVNGPFMSARGGKLPGFCGDSSGIGSTATGGNYSGDGFSIRPMFHRHGGKMCLYAYVYQFGNPNGGDQSGTETRKGEYFPARNSSHSCFEPNTDVRVKIQVRFGPAGAGKDCVQLTANDTSVVMNCRFHLRNSEAVKLKRICLHVFAGGDSSWAPVSPAAALCMRNLRVASEGTFEPSK